MKLFMAYVVVTIHTTDWSLLGLTETAVPYFFIASGYFLFKKMGGTREEDLTVLSRWIDKVLKLYLIWTVIYLPFTVVGYFRSDLELTTYILAFFRNLVFSGENYLSWPLWYLLALLWDGAIIYLMRRLKLPVGSMFLIGLLLFISGQLFNIHRIPYYTKLFLTTRNGIFIGLVYVTAGGVLADWVNNHSLQKAFPWVIGALVASFLAYQYSSLFLLPLTIGLFIISLAINPSFLKDNIARLLGSTSKTVYLTHMIFAGLAIVLIGMAKGWQLFLLAACLSSLLALILKHFCTKDCSWVV